MTRSIFQFLLILTMACALVSCSASEQEDERRPLSGTLLKMEDGSLCRAVGETTVIGEFAFEDLPPSETYSNDKMPLSDGSVLTAVDRRQTEVIKELKEMGFKEVSSNLPRCSVNDQDMGADAR